ncbi:MAG: DUF192 domain-containing protein [Alphaproteobacteria bacterium]|nr:DUF192 domain-containing protein [Alphaproteobacteria bacterium]
MNRKAIAIFVLLLLFIPFAFADGELQTGSPIKIPPPIEGLKKKPSTNTPQTLQKSDIEIEKQDGTTLKYTVELAITPQQQSKGMMFRTEIPDKTGMMFLFPDSKERNFWMKNTPVALDIIFIREDGLIHHIHENAEPESMKHIPSYGEVNAVLEIAGGKAKEEGIAIGDRIIHDAFTSIYNKRKRAKP